MKILEHPSIYHSYQLLGGFFRARLKAFHEFIDFSKVGKIIDIGKIIEGINEIINKIDIKMLKFRAD